MADLALGPRSDKLLILFGRMGQLRTASPISPVQAFAAETQKTGQTDLWYKPQGGVALGVAIQDALLLACILALLSPAPSLSAPHMAPVAPQQNDAVQPPASFSRVRPHLPSPADAASVRIDLPAIAPAVIKRASETAQRGRPLRIGLHRYAPAAQAEVASRLRWWALSDGRVAGVFMVRSPGAKFIRASLDAALPAGAELRFFSPSDDGASYPSVRRHEMPAADEPFWTPTVAGDVMGVEVTLRSAADTAGVRLSVRRIAHRWANASSPGPAALQCSTHVDATCPSLAEGILTSVARVIFDDVQAGLSYVCSGVLLASDVGEDEPLPPYFLTARHCISDTRTAASVEVAWFHQSGRCNGGSADRRRTVTSGGATLLASSVAQDSAFLRLRRGPPSGVWLAGWDQKPMREGASAFTLHHPDGEWKKYAAGTMLEFNDILFDDGDRTRNAIIMRWSSGATEAGSSGAPLFRDGQYVAGVLSGGDENCRAGRDGFGNFNEFYPQISSWLRPGGTTRSPDLTLESMRTDLSRVDAGGSINLSVRVRNLGDATAPSGQLHFYQSRDARIARTGDVSVGSVSVPSLAPSASASRSRRLSVSGEGVRYYGACMVAVAGESNVNNNCSAGVRVVVDPPAPPPQTNGEGVFDLPLVWDAMDRDQQGFVRIRNLASESANVSMYAYDSSGRRHGPITINFAATQVRHFNTNDLYYGNPDKGVSHGFGADGRLRLRLQAPAGIRLDAQSYNRTPGGFLTAMLPSAHLFPSGETDMPWSHYVPTFNPGGNQQQVSHLYIANPHDAPVRLIAIAEDDWGMAAEDACAPADPGHLPPHASVLYSAKTLEDNCWGGGRGKWTVFVLAERRLDVVSLLYSAPARLWTNLTVREHRDQAALNDILQSSVKPLPTMRLPRFGGRKPKPLPAPLITPIR